MRYGYDRIARAPEGAGGGSTGTGVGEAGGAPGGTGDGAGNGGGEPAAGAPGPGGTGSGAGAGGSWLTTPEEKAWAESKGWKSDDKPDVLLPKVVSSYKNLEQLFGADKAGRTVLLPKDATDTAATEAIFTKLGKPAAADGYSIELPEGADPSFANTMKGVFHKANLTVDQAKNVTDAYRAAELDAAKAAQDFIKTDEEGLRKEWGDKFDANRETARAAIKAAGLTDADVETIVGAVGPSKMSKIFEFYGRNYVEASPPGQEGRSAPGFGSVTPASAQAKIDQLYADKNFMDRMGHADPRIREGAMMEIDALTRVAVNGQRK